MKRSSPPNLLPVRPKPLEDELTSQWIVRLAKHNRQKLHHFSWRQLGLPKSVWYRDIDRSLPDALIDRIGEASGTECDQARATSLRSWQGVLWEKLNAQGSAQWLMQVKTVGRIKKSTAQQFCVSCLEEGTGHFRKRWRLMIPFCVEHREWLHDRCPKCASAINFHSGDYGWPLVRDASEWHECGTCGHDLRLAPRKRTSISDNLVRLMGQVDQGLKGQWVEIGSHQLHPLAFFRGIRILLCIIASNKQPKEIRRLAAGRDAPPAFRTALTSRHLILEDLEVEERVRLFELLAWLLEDWPFRFVATFQQAKVKSDWFRKKWQVPWWLEQHISTSLNGTFYRPSPMEREAAILYLTARGLSTSRNNLRRVLGLSYIENHRYVKNR